MNYEIEFVYRNDNKVVVSEKINTDVRGIVYNVTAFTERCIKYQMPILEINITEQKRAQRKYL